MNKKNFNFEEFIKSFDVLGMEGGKILIRSNMHKALEYVSDNYSFDILKSITAIDLKEKGIELIYHLFSTENEENLRLYFITKDEADSITDIFSSAQVDEDEIYDMFGVNFIGNESLKRLYMPESWQGYPLRKDYVQDDTRLAWNDNKNV